MHARRAQPRYQDPRCYGPRRDPLCVHVRPCQYPAYLRAEIGQVSEVYREPEPGKDTDVRGCRDRWTWPGELAAACCPSGAGEEGGRRGMAATGGTPRAG